MISVFSKLSEIIETIQSSDLEYHSLLVIRNGYLVMDAYFEPYSRETILPVHSVTKGLTSTLTGIAINEGFTYNEDRVVLE